MAVCERLSREIMTARVPPKEISLSMDDGLTLASELDRMTLHANLSGSLEIFEAMKRGETKFLDIPIKLIGAALK